jgi:hypothetical protein
MVFVNAQMADPKPPKLVTVYLPSTLAVIAGVGGKPMCECTGYSMLLFTFGAALGTFLFSWPFILAGYHGYRFFIGFIRGK